MLQRIHGYCEHILMSPQIELLYKHNLYSEVENTDQTIITLIIDHYKTHPCLFW